MTSNLPAERKPQLVAGAPVAALVPQTLEEAFRLSGALAASGMAPRGIDKPEQIMVAIMAGAELGLAPFQALQSFAIVNGRPALYGDGLMAVARQHGVRVREWIEGHGEAMVAHCEVTRPDGEVIERTFTVAQAKRAGLWGKAGPWTQYPERMTQMRARAWALRDGCADMLRGIQVREEVEDYTHAPARPAQPSGLRDRLAGAPVDEGFTSAQRQDEPTEFAEQAAEIADAEFSDPNIDEPAADETIARDDTPDEPAAWDHMAWAQATRDQVEMIDDEATLMAWWGEISAGEDFGKLLELAHGEALAVKAAVQKRRNALRAA